MTEFKFVCPECGQKIMADINYCGREIACPACQKPFTVPLAAPGLAAPVAAAPVMAGGPGGPPPLPVAAHASQPATQRMATATAPPPPQHVAAAAAPPPPRAPANPPPPQRTAPAPRPVQPTPAAPVAAKTASSADKSRYSVLAMASLLCSVWVGLGFIPGIICGHLAKRRMRQDIFLEGEKMANAGLIISYLVLTIVLVSAGTLFVVQSHFHPITVVRESPQELAALQPRVIDEVVPDQSSNAEEQHHVSGSRASVAPFGNKFRRRAGPGGSFSYEMKALPDKPMSINCRYWGSEQPGPLFDVAVDNQIIGTQELVYNYPGHYFDVEYKIPASLTRGKNQIRVEFQGHSGRPAGPVFAVQTLRR